MESQTRLVVVCTTKSFVARDFNQPGWSVLHNQGLWLPDVAPDVPDAWWLPTEHATWMAASGYTVPLVAPGPHWLTTLPEELLGRRVEAFEMAKVPGNLFPCWIKLAEVKLDAMPARSWNSKGAFTVAALHAHLPPTTWVQVSAELTGKDALDAEFRFFIADGVPVASSAYRSRGEWWQPGMTATEPVVDAEKFVRDVLTAVPAAPGSYVLDVARTVSGRWVVVEANPSWSSGLYDADPAAVLESLTLAALPDPEWTYVPDPYLLARVRTRRPLTR